jgi:hypothetical protein
MQYVQFFLGTPQRLVVTTIGVVLVWAAFNMGAVMHFFDQLLYLAVNKVLPLTVVGLLIALGFKMILGSPRGR